MGFRIYCCGSPPYAIFTCILQDEGSRIAKEYRTNDRIRIAEVLLIDERGSQLGVMPTREALRLADERSLDLVEVAPSARPPVCRIMDYGKFRYEVTRREREARRDNKSKGASNELKEVRFKTRIGDHDREAKTRVVRRLLGEGAKVKVSVMFRGREITHPEIGMQVLRKVAEDLKEDAKVEKMPGFEGRFLSMIVSPAKKKQPQPKQTKTPEPASAQA